MSYTQMYGKYTCGTVRTFWKEEQVFLEALWDKYTSLCFDQFSWSSEPSNCKNKTRLSTTYFLTWCWKSGNICFVSSSFKHRVSWNQIALHSVNRPWHSPFILAYLLLNQRLLHFILCNPPAAEAQSYTERREKAFDADSWCLAHLLWRHNLTR